MPNIIHFSVMYNTLIIHYYHDTCNKAHLIHICTDRLHYVKTDNIIIGNTADYDARAHEKNGVASSIMPVVEKCRVIWVIVAFIALFGRNIHVFHYS